MSCFIFSDFFQNPALESFFRRLFRIEHLIDLAHHPLRFGQITPRILVHPLDTVSIFRRLRILKSVPIRIGKRMLQPVRPGQINFVFLRNVGSLFQQTFPLLLRRHFAPLRRIVRFDFTRELPVFRSHFSPVSAPGESLQSLNRMLNLMHKKLFRMRNVRINDNHVSAFVEIPVRESGIAHLLRTDREPDVPEFRIRFKQFRRIHIFAKRAVMKLKAELRLCIRRSIRKRFFPFDFQIGYFHPPFSVSAALPAGRPFDCLRIFSRGFHLARNPQAAHPRLRFASPSCALFPDDRKTDIRILRIKRPDIVRGRLDLSRLKGNVNHITVLVFFYKTVIAGNLAYFCQNFTAAKGTVKLRQYICVVFAAVIDCIYRAVQCFCPPCRAGVPAIIFGIVCHIITGWINRIQYFAQLCFCNGKFIRIQRLLDRKINFKKFSIFILITFRKTPVIRKVESAPVSLSVPVGKFITELRKIRR